MSRARPLLGAAMVVAALALAGCAAETPVCNAASPLLESGRVAAATELYARAAQSGEGSCAESGLASAGEQYGRAYAEVAAGSADELGGDPAAATAHYEAAQRLDVGNAAAVAGLARLGNDTATRTETPVAPPAPVPPRDGVGWWAATVALVGVLALAGAGGVLLWRRLARITETVTATRSAVEEDLGEHQDQATQLSRDLHALAARVEAISADRGARVEALHAGLGEVRRSMGSLHGALTARTTDQLRLLCLVREQTLPTPTATPPSAGSEVVLHWNADGPDGPDGLTIVVVTSPRPDDRHRRVLLHDFRVAPEVVDLASALDDGAFRCALGELAARPEDATAVTDLAEQIGADVETRGRRTHDAVEGDGMVVPQAEWDFWRSLDGTVLMRWTRSLDGAPRRSDVCAVAPSPRTAASITPLELVRALLDGDESGDGVLRHALDLALVDAAAGTGVPELAAPARGLLRVTPDGRTEAATAAQAFGT